MPTTAKVRMDTKLLRILSKAGIRVIFARGALLQPSGRIVPAGAPLGPSPAFLTVLSRSPQWAQEVMGHPLLHSPPYFPFIRPHYVLQLWRKRIWKASSDQRLKRSPSASRRDRGHSRPCDTSCQSAQAPQLLLVTLSLRRLSSTLSLHLPLSLPRLSRHMGVPVQPDAKSFLRARAPGPKIALDLAPQASSSSAGQEEEGAKSRHGWTIPPSSLS